MVESVEVELFDPMLDAAVEEGNVIEGSSKGRFSIRDSEALGFLM